MNYFNVTLYNKNLNTTLLGKPLLLFSDLGSTNDYSAALEKKVELYPGTVIVAEIQTKGRGKLEAKWASPPGGLYFTLTTLAKLDERHLPKITLISALAIYRAMTFLYGLKLYIKWPNDLYFNQHKLAGILTETEKIGNSFYVNIGVGINVNSTLPDLKPYQSQATSLRNIMGKRVSRERLLAEIINNFEPVYLDYLKTGDFASLFSEIEKNLIY